MALMISATMNRPTRVRVDIPPPSSFSRSRVPPGRILGAAGEPAVLDETTRPDVSSAATTEAYCRSTPLGRKCVESPKTVSQKSHSIVLKRLPQEPLARL